MTECVIEEQFICRYCDKPLYSPRSLQLHEDKHTENLKFQCTYCDKTFPNLNSLTRHEQTHSGDKDYLCPFCELGFNEKNSLVNHITKMHSIHLNTSDLQTEERKPFLSNLETIKSSQKPIQTQQIRNFPVTSSKSENYVSTTTRAEGSKEARFQCGYCEKSFATPSKVKRHILTHTGEKPFVCQFCQRGFSQKVHMMEHISKHHADESLKAQQEAAAAAAAAAAVAQAAAPAPLIKTLPSNKIYATQTITTSPLINSSQSQLRLPSSQTITTAQVVADTTAVQIPIPGNSYIVAEFSLKPDSDLSDQDQVDTTDCHDKGEIMAIPMSQHNLEFGSLTKPGEGPFLSSATSYQTISQSNERPFVCPHCSADFIRQSNLSVHMMKVHGEAVEVRTHQCTYCDKKFKYPNKKRLHEMTHTGEKPNVCQFCTMGFFKKSRLRAHLTKVHGIPEDEVSNPNSSYLQNPTSTTQTIIQKTVTINNSSGEHFCQYCQKPFSNRTDLLIHERQEAMEFEQLHEMFEDSEFTGLEVNGQTDIIQNALLTAGIENGLGSPSVTDSDSVVTISEADIDSFSIGFIPDANWSNEVSTNCTSSNNSGDPFSSSLQPLDLKFSHTDDHTQSIQTSSHADLQAISGTIYTSSDSFQNIKTEAPSLGEINQMWETTVALSGVPTTLNSIIKSEPLLSSTQGEIFTTSTSTLNGIYTETFTIPSGGLTQEQLNASIISIAGGSAQIINGADIDFSKLQAGSFTVSAQQLIDADSLTTNFHPSLKSQIQWVDDASLPAGWKTRQHYREGQLSKVDTYYMAPDGAQFRSKWKVVEYMEASGSYCQEEIDWVKSSITTAKPDSSVTVIKERSDKLKREWKDDDPTVPADWKVAWTTTSDNRAKIAFMSPDKKIFHSRKSALQYMLAAGTYSQLDIEKMTKGLNVLLNVGDEWKEGDKSLPDGWKIRSHQWWCQKRNSHRIHYEFLSPQNEFFKSRKAVVEHMTNDGNYTQDQIEMVRLQTTPQTDKNGKKKPAGPIRQDNSPSNPLIGWKAGNTTLPPGWKIKRHEYANQTVYFYMSPKGDIIKSRRGVIDYMFDDRGYEEKDFNIVISGAKQRKVALQELYENKTCKKRKKKKGKTMPEDPDLLELDIADSDDNMEAETEDLKKSPKKPKIDKELIQPTRRSGRVASKIKERRKHESEDEEDDEDVEDGKRKAEDELEERLKRARLSPSLNMPEDCLDIKQEEDMKSEVPELDIQYDLDIKSENAKDIEFKEEEEEEEEEDEEDEDEKDLLENSIQYLDSQDHHVSLGDIMVDANDIQEFKKYDDLEVKLHDGSSLVNVTNSNNVEHSAYNVVVNVLTDIVSTISE